MKRLVRFAAGFAQKVHHLYQTFCGKRFEAGSSESSL